MQGTTEKSDTEEKNGSGKKQWNIGSLVYYSVFSFVMGSMLDVNHGNCGRCLYISVNA